MSFQFAAVFCQTVPATEKQTEGTTSARKLVNNEMFIQQFYKVWNENSENYYNVMT